VHKRVSYKTNKGDALIDVIVGVSLIALIAWSSHDAILNLSQQSQQMFQVNRATWIASTVIEILSEVEFDDLNSFTKEEFPGAVLHPSYAEEYPDITADILVSYLQVVGGSTPSITPSDTPTDLKKVQVTVHVSDPGHSGMLKPIVLQTIISR
jgi:hypothetical protein